MSAAYLPKLTKLIRRWLLAGLLLLAPVLPQPTAATEPQPFDIGIAPYYSTKLLFEQYEPLRAYLSNALHRPVFLATAKDFRTFALRTRAYDYHFIFTVPHFGRLAEVDDGYRPLLQMKAQLQGTFLVARTSPARKLEDLRGRVVATPDRLAIITMMGEKALAASGLDPDRDLWITPKPTHNAAVLSVVNGESDAALVWHQTMASMDPSIAAGLRVLASTEELPTFVHFLAAPQVPAEDADAVRSALEAFGKTEAGRAFLNRASYGPLVPLGRNDSAFLDSYLPKVRRALDAAADSR